MYIPCTSRVQIGHFRSTGKKGAYKRLTAEDAFLKFPIVPSGEITDGIRKT